MKKILCVVFLFLLTVCAFGQSDFRVGGAWKPIPFSQSNFQSYITGTWVFNYPPEIFQYKSLGDTVLVNISNINGGVITEDTLGVFIVFPDPMPPIQGAVVGNLIVRIMQPDNSSKAYQAWFYAAGNYIGILPMPGQFPNDKWPAGSALGVNLTFFYPAVTN